MNELLIFAVHIISILMFTEWISGIFDKLKNTLIYCIIIIWINNSAFSVITLLSKIIGYIKSKIASKKVQPEVKTEKKIAITNLIT